MPRDELGVLSSARQFAIPTCDIRPIKLGFLDEKSFKCT